ncbi:MAG: hypothetical protein LOY58_07065 [Gammaproteobacteria bacterium]|jgi:uncharacterized membrane protein|nr:hypothetical protein [Gammaproteobacteria bacterium]
MTKTFGQKITYLFAILCFVAAVASGIAAFVYEPRAEMDPIHASLMASAFFFGSCAVVLYVIGTTRLKGILSHDKND